MSIDPRINGYAILERLGREEGGRLYKARQLSLQRDVLLKVLDPNADPKARERFLREAKVAARLRHPNVLTLHTLGTCPDTGERYLAFEWLPGARKLSALLSDGDGRLPLPRALAVAADVAEALACAEEQRVVHRDVRPERILVAGSGRAKLAGLGLSSVLDPDGASPAGTASIGSPLYAAPELSANDDVPVDGRADLYGLGMTLYRALEGRLLYEAQPLPDRLEALRDRGLPLPADLPEAVRDVLSRLAAWFPGARYSTVAEARDALRAIAPQSDGEEDEDLASAYLLETGRFAREPLRVRASSGDRVLCDVVVEQERFVVGRAPGVAVRIDDPRVSRRQLEFRRRGDRLEVTPLSASNPTLLNGRLLRNSSYVRPGDELLVAERFRLTLEVVDPLDLIPETETEKVGEDTVCVRRTTGASPCAAEPRSPTGSAGAEDVATEATSRARRPSGSRGVASALLEAPLEAELALPPPGRLRLAEGASVRVTSLVSLGSAASCELRLPRDAPGRAALVVRSAGGHWAVNLTPSEGTLAVDGVPVPDRSPLRAGQRLEVAGVGIVFELEEAS